MAGWGGAAGGDGFALGKESAKGIEGANEGEAVADAGDVHGFFEGGDKGRAVFERGEVLEGSVDVGLDLGAKVALGVAEVGLGCLGAPLLADAFVLAERGLGGGGLLLGVEVDETLSLVLGEAKVFEDARGLVGDFGIEFVTLGDFEVVFVRDLGLRGFGLGGLSFGRLLGARLR